MRQRPQRSEPRLNVERQLELDGFAIIVGCDEAGRGPLAGPVVAAAVRFRDCDALWNARDSKILTAKQRNMCFEEITSQLEFAVVAIEPDEIDRVNIRVASLVGMQKAVDKLGVIPNIVLVDGRDRLPSSPNSRAIVDGDALVATIGAASIVAKVTRDRLMCEYHELYPLYGFDRHFGYPTDAHRRALREHGPCPIHRRSYRGVRELIETL